MFRELKDKVNAQLEMITNECSSVFILDVDKDKLWDAYIDSFKPEDNPVFREHSEHDCSCCRQFIKNNAGVVGLKDGNLIGLWDFEISGVYENSVNALRKLCNTGDIDSIYLSEINSLGFVDNYEEIDGKVQVWEHFNYKLNDRFVNGDSNISIASKKGDSRSTKGVFKRALDELKISSTNFVLELIDSNNLYRGIEFKQQLMTFLKYQRIYLTIEGDNAKDLFAWEYYREGGRVRNSAIGSLLVDLSEGIKSQETCVKLFEAKVSPLNYKRPKALITKSMVDNAEKEIKSLGVEESIYREHASLDKIHPNNLIFNNIDASESGSIFDDMKQDVIISNKLKNIKTMSLVDFKNLIVSENSFEILFENKHIGNLVNVISPKYKDSESLMQWDNGFSWDYKDGAADSMKEVVSAAGGKVNAIMRQSLMWNESGTNNVDLDIHLQEPAGGAHIYYQNKGVTHPSTGFLDIDVVSPEGEVAVENITHSDIELMPEGKYELSVNNYSRSTSKGTVKVELEYDGQLWQYEYSDNISGGGTIVIATYKFTRKNGIEIISSIDSTVKNNTKDVWGIGTNKFHKVRAVMDSPNYWDGESTGNKHTFFILDNAENDESCRGFYNEFLKHKYMEYKRFFEVLGSKIKVEPTGNQVAGLGFSSTIRKDFIVRVNNRLIKVEV